MSTKTATDLKTNKILNDPTYKGFFKGDPAALLTYTDKFGTGPNLTETDSAKAGKALDARARRVAKSVGLIAEKSRARNWSLDNHQGFRLLDASTGFPQDGFRFELTAEYVIEYCREIQNAE